MIAAITVDVEQDCPPYLETWRGIEEGLPRLLKLLEDERVPATFFCTGNMAKRFPDHVRQILKSGHELASHGLSHRKFTEMTADEANRELRESKEILDSFARSTSFRAPYLKFPDTYLSLVRDAGYTVDSSEARYKKKGVRVREVDGLLRVPASLTSSALRYPPWLAGFLLSRIQDPAVLFVHPWEFVDFRRSKLRLDCRFKTGDPALQCLRNAIGRLRRRKADFRLIRDLKSS